jgi:DNA-binding MarR family transcriptional regulator/GNAT superfamily N-acetyltransferase
MTLMTVTHERRSNRQVPAERIAAVRAFSRFFTTMIGILDEGLLHSPYSLTEARVIFELAQADRTEVVRLRRTLGLDPGYLSRMLTRFDSDGLVVRERSDRDARRQVIGLTAAGREVFAMLDSRSTDQIAALLAGLSEADQRRVAESMATIRTILGAASRDSRFVVRPLRPGDLGWVVHRHGVLYAEEYGWDESFEALVARIVADYVEHFDPRRANAWIAEVAGQPVGSVFCVSGGEETAKLRLLLVEPTARGMGIGARLVDECIRFARSAEYRTLTLWTNDVLVAARRIYQRVGFQLVKEERHQSFGHDLVGQYWSLDLQVTSDSRTGRGDRLRSSRTGLDGDTE